MIERYATVPTWAEWLESEEGVLISNTTIRNRLRDAEIIGKDGRDRIRRVLSDAFFSEADIRCVCADLLQPLPEADEFGFLKIRGFQYGMISAFARIFGVSETPIERRLNLLPVRPVTVRGRVKKGGQIHDFYAKSDVREACKDLLRSIPRADEFGFFEYDGILYGTITSLSRLLNISRKLLITRLKSSSAQPIGGRLQDGNWHLFYPEPAVRFLFPNLPDSLPQADESGFFSKRKIQYGMKYPLAKKLSISASGLSSRLKKLKIQSVEGRAADGKIRNFYPEPAVRIACADLLDEDLPCCGEDGFAEIGSIRYGTKLSLADLFGVSPNSISHYLASSNLILVRGRGRGGHPVDLWPEPAVRELCRDLIEKKKSNSKP